MMDNGLSDSQPGFNRINYKAALNCYRNAACLIKKKPLLFILSTCLFFIAYMLISIVSVIGQSVLMILLPVWLVGFYSMTEAVQTHSSRPATCLLNGFKNCFFKLLIFGLLFYFLFLLVVTVVFVCFIALSLGNISAESLNAMESMANIDKVNYIMAHFSPTFISWAFLTSGLLTLIPILMSLFCSPYLIYFKGFTLYHACIVSINCFINNIFPVSLLFILSIMLLLLGLLPLGLGIIIILPLLIVSSYLCCGIMFTTGEYTIKKDNLFSDEADR